MVYTSLDQTRLGQKEPLHAQYVTKKLNETDRPTDRPTDGHRHFKSSDGAKNGGDTCAGKGPVKNGTPHKYVFSSSLIANYVIILRIREYSKITPFSTLLCI